MKNRFPFPLVVAFVALVFYALTLSGGVTIYSLPFTMKVAGWDWQPMSSRPLAWLLTLPLRLLPGGWIPVALNLFSALTAAATLGILARSVQRLPWDCKPDAQKIWALRLPALLACAVCGLEFNFWQDATAMTGEMLGVFLFAASIGCVLEFRAGKNPRWLDAAAVVWGVGLAENWAMQLMLPLFLAALAWLPGLKKIGKRFFIRLALLAVAAIFVFSLQPLANGLTPHSPWNLKEAWLASLQYTKGNFRTIYLGFWSWHRLLTLVLLFYFLLPVLAYGVRIKNEGAAVFGVERMQVRIFRTLRAGLLLACLWLAFDPEVGPRKIILKQFGLSLPLLTFDYLLVLGTAFLAGSLLFAAQIPPRERLFGPLEKMLEFVRRSAVWLLTAFFIFAVAALAAHSWPGIAQARQTPLADAGELVVRSLPADGGIVVGDDAAFLMVVRSALAQHRLENKWQTVDLQLLPGAKYRAALEAKYPAGGHTNGAGDLTPGATLDFLDQIARRRRIFYLLPEPGSLLFENVYTQPQGAVHELKNYAEKTFAVPALTAPEIAANEKFWDAAWEKNLAAAGQITSRRIQRKPGRLMLLPVMPDAARQLGRWYSIALNNWGVELQRNGKLAEAQHRFEQAQLLNPDNPSVPVNLHVNSNLLAGKNLDLSGAAALVKSVSGVQQLARIIADYGTVDEPSVCLLLGEACFAAGWPRQALQQLDRARTLAPDSGAPELAMAKIYSRIGADSRVMEMVSQLRRLETNSPAGRALGVELSLLEAKSWLAHTNLPQANRVLESVLQKNPGDPAVWDAVFKVYLSKAFLFSGSATNALGLLDRLLTKEPDNIPALNNKSAVLVQLQRAAEAIPILDRAIALTNLPAIKLNRAIALLQAQDLPAAEAAYRELQTTTVDQFSVKYGLAQIAEARHDTNAALNYYSVCLTNAATGSVKWLEAKARLTALQKPAAPR